MATHFALLGTLRMQVISYVSTLPGKLLARPHEDAPKVVTLTKFAQGVQAAGDQAEIYTDMLYKPSDVAMMVGWVHEHGKIAPHLRLRQEILDRQLASNRRVVIADSNLFLYKDTSNPHYYLRYSFDGVFPNTGEYCDSDPDPERWTTIQRDMNIHLRDWRSAGDHVLMCLQRNGGWSMNGFDVIDWALITAKQLRQHTDRPIRIRSHPGDKKAGRYCHDIMSMCQRHGITGIEMSESGSSLSRDFKHCWALINHNSSPAVGAAIEGIPVFVTDPARSQAHDVANADISRIENPLMPDRQAWIKRISQFHWSHEDLTSGRCWSHMRKWAKK
jgi:hypothetical protein